MNMDDSRRSDHSSAPAPVLPALPDDPDVLKSMIAELLATLNDRDRQNEQLRHRLDQLLRRLYGPRAEKFDPNQPWLFPELPAAEQATPPAEATPAEETTAPAKKKNGHGRRRLPDSLPRIRRTYTLRDAELPCAECGTPRSKIGEEISEQLDYQPASLFVVEHVRCTYACPKCQGHVTTADKPAQPIAKGLPGPGLLAQIITSKYGDYLPLYRLERIFGRHGLELSRSTTCGWMAACAALLGPLYHLMVTRVLQAQVLHTDDTVMPVQDPERDRTRQGRLWVYLGDRDHPYTVFDFTPNHSRDGPQRFLGNYRGFMQADAFGGYDGIYLGSQGAIIEVACNAHARRKFYDARTTDPPRAHTALGWYKQLYGIEHQIRDELDRQAAERDNPLSAADADALVRAWRQEKALPIWTAFRAWLLEQQSAVLPKSPIGQAIGYTLGNWDALVRYTEVGLLAIDNNAAEREMKRIAIGRKNFLFVGSDAGGKTAAVLFSMTASCHRHGIDAFAYLRDVLDRLAGGPLQGDALAALLPDRWAAPPASTSPA
jgi:transposase